MMYTMCETDTLLLSFSIQENYPRFYNLEDTVSISNSISDGDIFRSYMYCSIFVQFFIPCF